MSSLSAAIPLALVRRRAMVCFLARSNVCPKRRCATRQFSSCKINDMTGFWIVQISRHSSPTRNILCAPNCKHSEFCFVRLQTDGCACGIPVNCYPNPASIFGGFVYYCTFSVSSFSNKTIFRANLFDLGISFPI